MSRSELRRYALSLPGVEERETWGHPTFRVRGKIFASFPEPGVVLLKTTPSEQQDLLASDADTFSEAPRLGRFGWVTARLDRADPVALRDLVHGAWHRTAPASLRGREG